MQSAVLLFKHNVSKLMQFFVLKDFIKTLWPKVNG